MALKVVMHPFLFVLLAAAAAAAAIVAAIVAALSTCQATIFVVLVIGICLPNRSALRWAFRNNHVKESTLMVDQCHARNLTPNKQHVLIQMTRARGDELPKLLSMHQVRFMTEETFIWNEP